MYQKEKELSEKIKDLEQKNKHLVSIVTTLLTMSPEKREFCIKSLKIVVNMLSVSELQKILDTK